MMRTLVKTTPFDMPNLSSAIAAPPLSSPTLQAATTCSSLSPVRVRSDMLRGEASAFFWLLYWRPMAATRQRLELSAPDSLRKPSRRARWRDRIVFARHKDRRAADKAQIRALRRRWRLAGLGEALRVLTQVALTHECFGDRIVSLRRRRKPGRHHGVGDSDHARPARNARAVEQSFTGGCGGFADRAEQGQARDPFGRGRGKMLRNEGPHRLGHDMRGAAGDGL